MPKSFKKTMFLCLLFVLFYALSYAADAFTANLTASASQLEVGQSVSLSYKVKLPKGAIADFKWKAEKGSIIETPVAGEINFAAPDVPGDVTITGIAKSGGKSVTKTIVLTVLPKDALKKTATVIVEVDTTTLTNVYVSDKNPSESFHKPLMIKGTFRYDDATEMASAGGSWPTFNMYDDGTHGDRVANDGIWTIKMEFEKTDAKVEFAFDDGSPFRMQFESGLAWKLKISWMEPGQPNPIFIPDHDQIVQWDAKKAVDSGLYKLKAQ